MTYDAYFLRGVTALAVLVSCACGSNESSAGASGGSGASTSGGGAAGTGGSSGSGGKAAPSCAPSSETEAACGDGKDDDCDGFADCLDSDCEGKTCGGTLSCLAGACLGAGALPSLPRIENVLPTVRHDNVYVDFFPVAGAKDYRIYALPKDEDILVGQNGEVAIRNAVYRCGGAFGRDDRSRDDINIDNSLSGNTAGFNRAEEDSVLGYVFTTPAAGRIPVYRVGNPNQPGGYAWEYLPPPSMEYTGADYVTSTEARDALLAKGWRDDGIAFYTSSAATKPVYRKAEELLSVYFTDGAERDARGGGDELFRVLSSQEEGAVPLYRIHYAYHADHDVLAPGDLMKERVLLQGSMPVTSLLWPGLKEKTTLVIEALDQGCPFPGGYISAMSAPAADLGGVMSEPTLTLDQARLSSGEVFVNGQYEPTNRPKPIARAYVTVEPQAAPQMDWFQSFDEPLDSMRTVVDNNIGTRVFRNENLSVEFEQANASISYGSLLGQFVIGSSSSMSVAAVGANAQIASDKYLHVTMSVDAASTGRRYPQIWITTAPLGDPNVQSPSDVVMSRMLGPRPSDNVGPGQYKTIIAQTFGAQPELQLQFCDLRGWGVSAQCPKANIYGYHAGSGAGDLDWSEPWLPLPLVGDYAGMDRLVKFDVYASTSRVYMFVEDRPAGCAILPEGRMDPGPVTVVYSFAAYHIEIDEYITRDPVRIEYWRRYSVAHAERKADDLGVKSGAELPPWDEKLMPCGSRYYGGQ